MARRTDGRDEGAALVLVLVLMTVLSIGLATIFAGAGANLRTSVVLTEQNQKTYAADAGVESAIQQLRTNSALCPSQSTGTLRVDGQPSTLPPDTQINGRNVVLTCQAVAGRATSVSPWALVATGNLLTQGTATITGPVYVTGSVSLGATMTVNAGLYQRSQPGCPGSNLNGPWTCTNAPTPDPVPAFPTIGLKDRGPDPAFTLTGGCSVFLPGRYTALPNFGAHNYFASGVYYFKDVALTAPGSGGELIGGRPSSEEVAQAQALYGRPGIVPSPACASDRDADVDDGSGVELILGGTSTINFGAHDVEFYRRIPGSQSEGAAGISIRTVPASGAPATYSPSTVPAGSPTLAMPGGNAAGHLAVHGLVYVPGGSVNLTATNNGAADLLSGLVSSDLEVQPASSGSTGDVISTETGPQTPAPRYVSVTATAQTLPSDLGSRDITSTAVVAIGNDQARTVTVQSWVTCPSIPTTTPPAPCNST